MGEWIEPELIQKAKAIDAYSFLVAFCPGELVKVGSHYCTKQHDSLRITPQNGKWHWYSQGIGGTSAVSYLQAVEGMTFQDAVRCVLNSESPEMMQRAAEIKLGNNIITERVLKLPNRSYDDSRMKNYLINDRNIDPEIVDFCIKNKLIYESFPKHNVVFVGYDEKLGVAKYGCQRGLGTMPDGRRFFGECTGSDKNYSFKITHKTKSQNNYELHIFEGAIDALSYATIKKIQGENWKTFNYLALGGVTKPSENRQYEIPKRISDALENDIVFVYLHLDNDEPGRAATASLTIALEELGYVVIDRPSPVGKDINDAIPYFKSWAKTHQQLIMDRQKINFEMQK